jgi:hypothetical protein
MLAQALLKNDGHFAMRLLVPPIVSRLKEKSPAGQVLTQLLQ